MSARRIGTSRTVGASRLLGMSYATEVVRNAPAAYYRLGEPSGSVMLDSSGLTVPSRAGAYTGSPTLGTTGLVIRDGDTAATFSGSGQYGEVAYNSTWMAGWTAMTIISWVKLSSTGANQVIVSRDASGSAGPFRLRVTNANKAEFLLWHSSLTQLAGSVTLSSATRYHIACTYDGTTMRLFVNGAADGTSAQTGALNTDTPPLRVGAYGLGLEPFAGVIDEVSIYNTALSGAAIAADYANGL